jgi:hypothetical protein
MMDEKLFGDMQKEIRGNDNGVPYKLTYIPKKDIAGDHSTDISYGAAAGLDPNRSLVFLLQADGAGLLSKSTSAATCPSTSMMSRKSGRLQWSRPAWPSSSPWMPWRRPSRRWPPVVRTRHAHRCQAGQVRAAHPGRYVRRGCSRQGMAPEPPPAPAEAPGAPTGGPAPGDQMSPPPPGALPPGMNPPADSGRPRLQMLMAGLRATAVRTFRLA